MTEDEMDTQQWIRTALIILVTAVIVSAATFLLTEYNIQLDCKTIGAFRVDSTGFKCEEIK
jgi:hypothetical protein